MELNVQYLYSKQDYIIKKMWFYAAAAPIAIFPTHMKGTAPLVPVERRHSRDVSFRRINYRSTKPSRLQCCSRGWIMSEKHR